MNRATRRYCHQRYLLACILASLFIAFAGAPQPALAQTGSADPCEAAQAFATADGETIKLATGSHEEQVAGQQAWRQALASLAAELPEGEARSAAETLGSAETVASDEPWTEAQEGAYQTLAQDLRQRCDIELTR